MLDSFNRRDVTSQPRFLLLRFTFSTCDFDLFDNSSCEFRRGVVTVKGCYLSSGEKDSVAAVNNLVGESVGEDRTINIDIDVGGVWFAINDRHLPRLKLLLLPQRVLSLQRPKED